MIVRPRTDWQAKTQPVTGPAYPKAGIVDVVYHYPGSNPGTSYADPVRALRAMQSDYLRNRGYSLGYSYAVDPTGVCWQIRGVDIRPAATAGYNDKGCAVQFMVAGQARANDAQMTAAVELHLWLEKHHGRRLGVTGHKFKGTTATPCPGIGITAQLPEIARRVRAAPTPPPSPPGPLPLGGPSVFIATWQEHWHYAVFVDKDKAITKRAATEAELNLVTMGGLLHVKGYDAWVASIPEFS